MVLLLMLLGEIDHLRYIIQRLQIERAIWHWARRSEYSGFVEEAEKRRAEAKKAEEQLREHVGIVRIGDTTYYQVGPNIRVEIPRVHDRDLSGPASSAAGQVYKFLVPVREVLAYGSQGLAESLVEFLRFLREKK
jgi:hypothetical protein